ncbi:DUF192 domain-containing protein [Sphingomonas sp. CARO-RG-8B-R24-01]|uniref:DUF192 domain-containing protein n=1 Tax=unclassified Sphingomonas TaxID=196159 RepID=UPI001F567E72
MRQRFANVIGFAMLVATGGCDDGAPAKPPVDAASGLVAVTVASHNGRHRFLVEPAVTAEEQRRGLMFRTDLAADGGMLFAPYPPNGPPREASFWMKDTPTPLDIIFVRADHTIARIAENAAPQSEVPVSSGEPVAAVLEIRGGRSLDLGIREGDTVSWRASTAR